MMAFDNDGAWVDDNNPEEWNPQADIQLEHGTSSDGDHSQEGHTDDNGGGKSQESMKGDLGDLYSEGAYDEWAHRDFDPGWYDRIVNKENLRADNEVGDTYHEDGQGGYLTHAQEQPEESGSSLLGRAGGGGSSGSGGNSRSGVNKIDDVYGYLKGLFPGGAFNQDVVNRRVDNVRGQLNTQRNSTMKNNEAYLADRGLIGSGPQAEAANSLDSRLFGLYGQSVNDINASESENADQRMMQALQMATGMGEEEARNAIAQFSADTDRTRMGNDFTLGQGNLALGYGNLAARNKEGSNSFLLGQGGLAIDNLNANNNYDIDAGQLQLDREKLQQMIESGDTDAALRYLELLQQGAATSAAGQQR